MDPKASMLPTTPQRPGQPLHTNCRKCSTPEGWKPEARVKLVCSRDWIRNSCIHERTCVETPWPTELTRRTDNVSNGPAILNIAFDIAILKLTFNANWKLLILSAVDRLEKLISTYCWDPELNPGSLRWKRACYRSATVARLLSSAPAQLRFRTHVYNKLISCVCPKRHSAFQLIFIS
jgi:hypothetical protein